MMKGLERGYDIVKAWPSFPSTYIRCTQTAEMHIWFFMRARGNMSAINRWLGDKGYETWSWESPSLAYLSNWNPEDCNADVGTGNQCSCLEPCFEIECYRPSEYKSYVLLLTYTSTRVRKYFFFNLNVAGTPFEKVRQSGNRYRFGSFGALS